MMGQHFVRCSFCKYEHLLSTAFIKVVFSFKPRGAYRYGEYFGKQNVFFGPGGANASFYVCFSCLSVGHMSPIQGKQQYLTLHEKVGSIIHSRGKSTLLHKEVIPHIFSLKEEIVKRYKSYNTVRDKKFIPV